MRIAIITPLFPPDIGEPAPYVKLLAKKLSATEEVSVLLYGRLPEKAGTAKLIQTDKRLWLFVRILLFFSKLLVSQHRYKIFLINNGPSTELPALLLALLRPRSSILIISDPRAKANSESGFYKTVHSLIKKRVRATIDITEQSDRHQPERHPFKAPSAEVLTAYEKWWEHHIQEIINYEK